MPPVMFLAWLFIMVMLLLVIIAIVKERNG